MELKSRFNDAEFKINGFSDNKKEKEKQLDKLIEKRNKIYSELNSRHIEKDNKRR